MIFIDFLKQLKQKNKKMFIFVLAVFFIYIENIVIEMNNISYIQLSPFTGYAMYSGKLNDQKSYTCYSLEINDGEKVNLWKSTQQNKQILQMAISYMRQFKENKDSDKTLLFAQRKLSDLSPKYKHLLDNYLNQPKDYNKFLIWYKRYIEQSLGKKIKSYKTQIIYVGYNKNKQVINDTIPLIEYKWKQ